MRNRTLFRCWPSSPSSSLRFQSMVPAGPRVAIALACVLSRSMGRNSRVYSTTRSTSVPASTCASTRRSTMARRSASSVSISVSLKRMRISPSVWPSCTTAALRCATGTPGWHLSRRSGIAPGRCSSTSTPQTLPSASTPASVLRSDASLRVHMASLMAPAATASIASRPRCTSGSWVWRASRDSTTSSSTAGVIRPSTIASNTVERIDSDKRAKGANRFKAAVPPLRARHGRESAAATARRCVPAQPAAGPGEWAGCRGRATHAQGGH